jgi:hypothetical protein
MTCSCDHVSWNNVVKSMTQTNVKCLHARHSHIPCCFKMGHVISNWAQFTSRTWTIKGTDMELWNREILTYSDCNTVETYCLAGPILCSNVTLQPRTVNSNLMHPAQGESLAALFSARQAETADRYMPTSVLHFSNGSPVTVMRSPAHYIYYNFMGSWLIYQKVKFRFLLDTSMFRAYFCTTKLLYEALDIKNSW